MSLIISFPQKKKKKKKLHFIDHVKLSAFLNVHVPFAFKNNSKVRLLRKIN